MRPLNKLPFFSYSEFLLPYYALSGTRIRYSRARRKDGGHVSEWNANFARKRVLLRNKNSSCASSPQHVGDRKLLFFLFLRLLHLSAVEQSRQLVL